tara:strand:- start:2 stop:880 length:879 start_codon:yes stop_codon:yes gene_type:complete
MSCADMWKYFESTEVNGVPTGILPSDLREEERHYYQQARLFLMCGLDSNFVALSCLQEKIKDAPLFELWAILKKGFWPSNYMKLNILRELMSLQHKKNETVSNYRSRFLSLQADLLSFDISLPTPVLTEVVAGGCSGTLISAKTARYMIRSSHTPDEVFDGLALREAHLNCQPQHRANTCRNRNRRGGKQSSCAQATSKNALARMVFLRYNHGEPISRYECRFRNLQKELVDMEIHLPEEIQIQAVATGMGEYMSPIRFIIQNCKDMTIDMAFQMLRKEEAFRAKHGTQNRR